MSEAIIEGARQWAYRVCRSPLQARQQAASCRACGLDEAVAAGFDRAATEMEGHVYETAMDPTPRTDAEHAVAVARADLRKRGYLAGLSECVVTADLPKITADKGACDAVTVKAGETLGVKPVLRIGNEPPMTLESVRFETVSPKESTLRQRAASRFADLCATFGVEGRIESPHAGQLILSNELLLTFTARCPDCSHTVPAVSLSAIDEVLDMDAVAFGLAIVAAEASAGHRHREQCPACAGELAIRRACKPATFSREDADRIQGLLKQVREACPSAKLESVSSVEGHSEAVSLGFTVEDIAPPIAAEESKQETWRDREPLL